MKQFLLNADGTYPNGMTEEYIKSFGLTPVIPTSPPLVVPVYHHVVEDMPIFKDGMYTQQWKLVSYTEEEIAKIEQQSQIAIQESNQV
jgi:hypothetical protein